MTPPGIPIRGALARALIAGLAALMAAFPGQPPAAAADKVRVVTTTTDLATLVSAIGGERVEVSSLSRGYQNPHFIEPRPSDVVKVGKARLFVEMGLDLETWASSLLDAAHNPRIRRIACTKGITVLDRPAGRVGPEHGDVHPYGNPHYHLDPANWIVMAETLSNALEETDPAGKAVYAANLAAFRKMAATAVDRWDARMAPFRGSRIIDYHRTWTYFAHRYGLQIVGYIESKPGIPPSPSHLESIIELARTAKVKAILQETWLDRRFPDLVARSSGARVVVLPTSVGAQPGTDGFEPLFDRIVDLVSKALR